MALVEHGIGERAPGGLVIRNPYAEGAWLPVISEDGTTGLWDVPVRDVNGVSHLDIEGLTSLVKYHEENTNTAPLDFDCGLSISRELKTVFIHGKELPNPLTRREFAVLKALGVRAGQIVSKRHILSAAWGLSDFIDPHVVDVHLAHVRNKLDAQMPGRGSVGGRNAGLIINRRGEGVGLVDLDRPLEYPRSLRR